MVLLSCNCPCACAITDEFQQQQQHDIGKIIKSQLSQKYETIYVDVSVCCCCCCVIVLLVFCRKDLCEARVNFEVSSNFQMKYPDKLSDIPPCAKLSGTGDEVFADLCCQ